MITKDHSVATETAAPSADERNGSSATATQFVSPSTTIIRRVRFGGCSVIDAIGSSERWKIRSNF